MLKQQFAGFDEMSSRASPCDPLTRPPSPGRGPLSPRGEGLRARLDLLDEATSQFPGRGRVAAEPAFVSPRTNIVTGNLVPPVNVAAARCRHAGIPGLIF